MYTAFWHSITSYEMGFTMLDSLTRQRVKRPDLTRGLFFNLFDDENNRKDQTAVNLRSRSWWYWNNQKDGTENVQGTSRITSRTTGSPNVWNEV